MHEASARYLVAFDTFRLPHHLTEVLVLGTGVAGYAAALAAAEAGARVLLAAKGDPAQSNTAWAQGGIAAVLPGTADTPAAHAADTLAVGQGLCDAGLVHEVTAEAAERIADLERWGARFDGEEGTTGEGEGASGPSARGLEAAHSHARVLHARGDATGAEIRDVLAAAAGRHPRVHTWGGAYLVDLLTDPDGVCRGALLYSRGHLRAIWAGAVVLATGGFAQVYRESSNWPGASGDGVAAAWRAGAALQDLEFVQFHPTTLYLAGVPRLLITEAVRGAGAFVVDDHGRRFLLDHDPRGELAPRDLISRAIMRHLNRPDVAGVFLDLTHLDAARMARRFPGVVASCRAHGLDIARDRIPIRPAAHYTIGGVRTDAQGCTAVPGLLAAGEVAASGLHGANRLASNSLLEGLVMGRRAGREGARRAAAVKPAPIGVRHPAAEAAAGVMDADDLRASLKAVLWREAGIERTGAHLTGAHAAVAAWERFAWRTPGDAEARWTLLNMLLVARLLTEAALTRTESRGTHFRRDAPQRDDARWLARLVHRRGEALAVEPLAAPAALVTGGPR